MEEETTQSKCPKYRELNEQEQDILFDYYQINNGSVLKMSLDKTCTFHSRPQLTHYVKKYGFKNKLDQIRTEKHQNIMAVLLDGKVRALEHAERMLQVKRIPLHNKSGEPVLDEDGYPLILEQLPHYRELHTAWKIIKTELGEPTRITNENLESSNGLSSTKKFLTKPITIVISDQKA